MIESKLNVFHEIHFRGFKKDPKEMKHFEIFGVTPHLRVVGKYVGSGKLLLLQVGGTGNGKFDFCEYME